ncbi:hypothetical protein [Phenylobacterium sp. J367]|uniref:hypothetical protein n=1 Tax=Phenylobacterium sp. J367 TaxID=2898435 RepID=UPI002151337F|nr:hypothetical protein [Phenylobacterium sp. J367]MCR5876981.1 hypothetical protein [Phenylobacterium sp. J367]MCR5881179.1 hypothetical protein [Phenylobacterium sp. J367]
MNLQGKSLMWQRLLAPVAPYLIGAALITLAGLWLMLDRANDRAAKAEAAAELARDDAAIKGATSESLDAYARSSRTLEKQAHEAHDAIRKDPGSPDVFEPSSTVCAELERMRGSPACTEG